MTINETIDSPHQSSRQGMTPQIVVIHIADGTYEGTKAHFMNNAIPMSQRTSSQFLIAADGRICQCVPISRMSWTNGTNTDPSSPRYFGYSTVDLVKRLGGNANTYSVSIEMEGFFSVAQGHMTPEQMNALFWLIPYIADEVRRQYNGHVIPMDRDHIVGHNEITPKTRSNCPGPRFQWAELISALQEHQPPLPPPEPSVLYGVVKQILALSNKENAENYAAHLNEINSDGFFYVVDRPVGSSGVLYGVVKQIVALSSRQAAEEYAAKMNSLGDDSFYYVLERQNHE